jgi:type II secretory pathway component HofQ
MPKVEFEEAHLGQVIEELVEATRMLDSSRKAINILLGPGVDPSSPVTLQLQNIPVGQVLKYIAKFSNLEIRIDGNAILLLKRKRVGR